MKEKDKKGNNKSWLSKKQAPRTMRSLIIEFMYLRFDKEDEDEDVFVENLIPGLPLKLQRAVKRHICLHGFMG